MTHSERSKVQAHAQIHKQRSELYTELRRQIERVWEAVKPVKLPARRRREDREIPKAA